MAQDEGRIVGVERSRAAATRELNKAKALSENRGSEVRQRYTRHGASAHSAAVMPKRASCCVVRVGDGALLDPGEADQAILARPFLPLGARGGQRRIRVARGDASPADDSLHG